MKKTLAFILAIAIILVMLTGCGSKPGSMSTPEEKPGSAAAAPAPTEDQIQETEEPDPYAFPFPLEETLNLTLFSAMDATAIAYLNDPLQDMTLFRELAKRFNVEIEATLVSEAVINEQFGIMVATGEEYDIVNGLEQHYVGGASGAFQDGYIIDIADYLDYCPNYREILEDKDLAVDIYSDGKIGSFVTIDCGNYGVRSGTTVRQDWLDELDMEMPTTYDGWTDMLEAFKVNYDPKYCLALHGTGVFTNECLTSGFGVRLQYQTMTMNSSPFYTTGGKDGRVHYGPVEQGCLDYLTLLNQWYEAGYFSSDFVNYTGWMVIEAEVMTNDVGVAFGNAEKTLSWSEQAEDPDFRLVPIGDPTKDGVGKEYVNHNKSRVTKGGWSVCSTSKYPELVCQLADWFYTDDGYLLTNYGVEHEGFEYVNGEPELTDLILRNPEGFSASVAAYLYTTGLAAGGWFYIEKNWKYYTDDMKACLPTWNKINTNSDSYCFPQNAAFTADEQQEYDDIMADINTYISENFLAFIMGERELDTFDDFVANIKSFDVDRAIELKQTALDRYYGKI